MRRGTSLLLRGAVSMPFLYFGTLFLSALFFPGYSHVTQYASELGSADAPYPMLFNGGIFLTAAAGLAAGMGFARAVRALGGHRLLGALAGLCVVLFAVSLILGAAFPMPDPRHGAFGLGLAILPAPFLLAASLGNLPSFRSLRTFLVIAGLGMLVLIAIMMGVGGLVTRANVGLFQRAFAVTTFPWVGVAGTVLGRHLQSRA